MSYCHLDVISRDEMPDHLDWMWWLEPGGDLRIKVARDASIEWTRRQAFVIVGGVLRAIITGRGQGRPLTPPTPPASD